MPMDSSVYQVTHSHRHGVSAIPCASGEDAWRLMVFLVAEYIDEIQDKDARKVLEELKDGNVSRAVLRYCEASREDIEIGWEPIYDSEQPTIEDSIQVIEKHLQRETGAR